MTMERVLEEPSDRHSIVPYPTCVDERVVFRQPFAHPGRVRP